MKKLKLLKDLVSDGGQILVPHIDAYLGRGNFPPTWDITIQNYKPKDDYFHPSSHCFIQPKQLYRLMKGLEQKELIGSSLRKTFDCGHMWHGYLEAIVQELGFVDSKDVEHYKIHEFRSKRGGGTAAGTGDLVNVEIPGQGTWLVDIKTMNAPEFASGPNEFTMKKWEAQVNCYGDWFKLDKMMILAVEKDSPHRLKEFYIQKNPTLLEEIYDRWSYVAQCLRVDMEPEQEWELDTRLTNPGDSALDVEVANET